MVPTKLVVASQALLLSSVAHGTFLAPQSLNEMGRSETSSEIQKIQIVEQSLRQVVKRLNGFSKKLGEQTGAVLSSDKADLAASVANMLDDNNNPRLTQAQYTTDGKDTLDWADLKQGSTWINYDNFLADAEVSTTHIAIHALTALITTYLDNLVPNQQQVMRKSYWSGLSARTGDDWRKFFLQPVNNEVVGYVVPSFAKLGYHLIMGMTPKTPAGHKMTRSTFSRQIFETPEIYPLGDTWTADNVVVVDDAKTTGGVKYATSKIVMTPTPKASAEIWGRGTAGDIAEKEKKDLYKNAAAGTLDSTSHSYNGAGQVSTTENPAPAVLPGWTWQDKGNAVTTLTNDNVYTTGELNGRTAAEAIGVHKFDKRE